MPHVLDAVLDALKHAHDTADGPNAVLHVRDVMRAIDEIEALRKGMADYRKTMPNQVDVAGQVERERCCKDVCIVCRDGRLGDREFRPAERDNQEWIHRATVEDDKATSGWTVCDAAAIRDRAAQEKT